MSHDIVIALISASRCCGLFATSIYSLNVILHVTHYRFSDALSNIILVYIDFSLPFDEPFGLFVACM